MISKISDLRTNFATHGALNMQETGFHTHSLGQLLFAEKGIIHIEYPDRKILLPMQYCSWIPPFKLHKIWSGSPDVFVRAIYFESHFCKNIIFSKDAIFPLSIVLKEMIRYTSKWNNIDEINDYKTTFLTAIRQMLPEEMAFNLMLEIPDTAHPLLKSILNHISRNFHNDIRIGQIGDNFGISVRTLHRLFIKELGQSFSTYLMFLRIIKAVELLIDGKNTIKEITYLIGYNSIPSFSNTFKQILGESPQSFSKKLHQANK
jgi:AraC-like DNA-binding protein